ncbi:efflux RND transporter periplasmic adaptor subunit [Variibacter gotjawalensis]|uniref:efflux RND transporter periplasmic adaptor subunit n=1 Tax=Variibacter gotjawalensis TaxID=1333996 RepID=UPI001D826E5E|nr:efflux RND transporter periplasmic adaptor subunit [Variibacter gotjawalensis]NIK47241.1 RND family efflux transporter MFP subunit [Variibacter gotjawalensis]
MALLLLAGCGQEAAPPERQPLRVGVETARATDYAPAVVLTGEVRARIQSDLSFRVSGRVIQRNVDVGAHVTPDQVLAEVDPQEQQANVTAAEATVQAAEAQLRQASSAFDRQKQLMDRGFTTRREYDQAEASFRTAEGTLQSAQAQLGTARDQLGHTILRAGVSGTITARNVEVGQVVQAAQTMFSIAQDGPRDAVFNVYESVFVQQPADDGTIELALISDPAVTAKGKVREVSPTIDPQTGTVRVKVNIIDPPPAMALGAPVVGSGKFRARSLVIIPAAALTLDSGFPAVWVVDPTKKTVSLRKIVIDSYHTGEVVLRDGVKPGEVLVTSGAQLLWPNKVVAFAQGGAK